MNLTWIVPLALLALNPDCLAAGDHVRSIMVGELTRSYLVHVPRSYDPKRPAPVVLALHPFGTNALTMARITGLSETADQKGFLAVYPNGLGPNRVFLAWNEGGMGDKSADEVGYIAKVLDDLALVAAIDPARVFATGMSNGAMMCYRLASELSDRIAAIAPVAGTMTFDECRPRRPVPVLHFHGTKDSLIPFGGPGRRTPKIIRFKSVEDTVRLWAQVNGCPEAPVTVEIARKLDDGLRVRRISYGPGRDDSEVILYIIEGGGHTWPGRELRAKFLGESVRDVSANDLMWEFFQKHPMKSPAS